ncbi:signal peptidase I [Pseudomonas sp. F1_0610]|uniref:signal peptidase I n=1 Tax=Pseudomonas sp. F1_0610 TaxID=3114284 RepID=UPI0039C2A2A6
MTLDFALILFIATVVCGLLALFDRIVLAPKRVKAIAQYESQVSQSREEDLAALKKVPVLVEYGKSFFPVLAVVFVLRSFLFEPFQIPSESMVPTLKVGDFIVVNKFSYGIRLPIIDQKIIPTDELKRGDVVVFKYPVDPSLHYIKRVVGLPGDVVTYTRDKRLVINDQLIDERFLKYETGSFENIALYEETLGDHKHTIRKLLSSNIREAQVFKVPDGEYLMMGDNRDNSLDSRAWGFVPDKNIVGKASVIWMTWPTPKFTNLPSFSRAGAIE